MSKLWSQFVDEKNARNVAEDREVAIRALKAIRALDLPRGANGYEFYLGAGVFFSAWLIADEALKSIRYTE